MESGESYVRSIKEASRFILERIGGTPDFSAVLGSGLGGFVDELSSPVFIPYSEVPGFPLSTVHGHASRFVSGFIGKKRVLCMQGRFHPYEGHPAHIVAIGVRTMAFCGAKLLLVTNAAGGADPSYQPGSLVLHTNFLGMLAENPSTGVHHPELGPQFYDMSYPYDSELRDIAKREYEKQGIPYYEGVYMMFRGPAYETAAEVNAARVLGATLVGMSTVPEVWAARQLGVRVLGISLVTNMAAGISKTPLYHEEVLEIGREAAQQFRKLVRGIIENT